MVPPPPVRLSMTSGWPRLRSMIGDSSRMMTSPAPPAEAGTITAIGLSGYSAAPERCEPTTIAAVARINVRRLWADMVLSRVEQNALQIDRHEIMGYLQRPLIGSANGMNECGQDRKSVV